MTILENQSHSIKKKTTGLVSIMFLKTKQYSIANNFEISSFFLKDVNMLFFGAV